MALLGRLDDPACARTQDLQKNNWHGLRTLLGQEVLSAVGAEQASRDATVAAALQARIKAALSALGTAIREHITDARQASNAMNAVQTAVFQMLASPSLQADDHDVGQQIQSTINHVDFFDKGPVQVIEAALHCLKPDCAALAPALAALKSALILLIQAGTPVERPDEMEEGVTMPVTEYQKLVLRRVCKCSWSAHHITEFLAFLAAVSPADQVPTVLKKLTDECIKAEAVDLPKIAEQVVALCSNGHKADTLQAIVDLADALEAASLGKSREQQQQLCQQQGQLLQWLRHKLPTNTDLAQGWLKQLKGRHTGCSAFMLALLLIMSDALSRLQQPITDQLQALVTTAFQADQHMRASAWLGNLASVPGPRGTDLHQALFTCIANTASSPTLGQCWRLLSRPVLGFAVALLEKGNVKAAELADALTGEEAAAAAAPQVAALQLGIKLLVAAFEADDSIREPLLREVQGRLVGVKEEVALPFVAVLGLLVHRHPRAVLQHANLLKAALDRFAFMTCTTALGVLMALQPLALLKKHIQAYMVGPSGVLRKALFSRGVPARLVAVRGLLYMIVQQLRTMDEGAGDDTVEADPELSLSQSLPASQQPSMSAGSGGVTLLHELMGLMRRSLTQQAPIREALYQGVHAILAADPSLQDSMLELLLPHFTLFLQDADDMPPLKLDACTSLQDDVVILSEPVDLLLTCVRQVLLLAKPREKQIPDSIVGAMGGNTTPSILRPAAEASQDTNPTQVLQGHFSQLKHRLLACEPADFSLGKDCDWNVGFPIGALHQTQAALLLGCLEVLIEDVVAEATGPNGRSSAEATGQQLTKLLASHDSLSTWAVEGRNAKPKKSDTSTQGPTQKRGRPTTNKATQAAAGDSGSLATSACVEKRAPVLSVSCLCRLLTAITENGLIPEAEAQDAGPPGTAPEPSIHVQLACSPMTQSFVLQSCLRWLHCSEPHPAQHAVVIGTAGDNANRAVAQELLAMPDWGLMAMPLIRAVQLIVQASTAAKGRSKGKQAGDKLPLLAVQCLDALLRLGRTSEGVAELLQEVMVPADVEPAAASTETDPAAQVIFERVPLLHHMLQTLLQAGRGREAEVLTHSLAFLGGLLPAALQQIISQSALQACEVSTAQVTHAGASKALIATHLSLAGSDDIAACIRVSQAIEQALGSINQESQTQQPQLQVTSKTGAAIATVLFTHMEGMLHAVEWLVSGLIRLPSQGECNDEQHADLENQVCLRLKGLAEVLGVAAGCSLKGPPCDHITKLLVITYRLLKSVTALTKAPSKAQQTPPSAALQDMVSTVHQSLTPNVYHFIFDASNLEDGDQNQAPNAEKKARKAKKEGKQIGLLVKAIEEWEFILIKLTRNCGLNLMRHAKKSTNRDFRITIQEVPEAQDEEAEQSSHANQESEEENAPAHCQDQSKRRKEAEKP